MTRAGATSVSSVRGFSAFSSASTRASASARASRARVGRRWPARARWVANGGARAREDAVKTTVRAREGCRTSATREGGAKGEENDGGTTRRTGLPPRALVESAMLAATTGLAFHLSSLFRFDAYFGALFPLPVVIARARLGRAAAMRTLVVATLLLLLISGPLRALNYFFLHGVLAYVLSSLWSSGLGWWVTVPASACTRTFGILASLSMSSLLYRENVMKLLVTQMYALLDQFAANIGATFAPSMEWVWATAMIFILINSFSYTLILHMVYTIVLGATQGRNFVNAPAKVCRALGVPTYPA
tara:strand:- start:2600 stop:3508 length:909 start_codon:yes stop_codon:yes gene_type:complete